MRKSVLFLLIVVTALVAVPSKMTYQGKLTDRDGIGLNGTYNMVFRIYNVPGGGSPLWAETHSGVGVSKGLFSVVLGTYNSITIPFDIPTYMEVVINGDVMSPRVEMATAAYAFHARVADSLSGWGSHWAPDDYVLYSRRFEGIAKGEAGNELYGDYKNTHVNLGVQSRTGVYLVNQEHITISGGYQNIATENGATVGGGILNHAMGVSSVVSGGGGNNAEAEYAAVGGGIENNVIGSRGVIPGGGYLTVGERSFGFRGGINTESDVPIDVSSEISTFHIVDAHFHFNPTNEDAMWVVDGTEDSVLYINSIDNLVGTGHILQVDGELRDQGGHPGNNQDYLMSTGDGIIWVDDPPIDDDWVIVGSNMHAGIPGNVGIGTGTPLEKLHIVGNILVTGTVDGYDVSDHIEDMSNPHGVTKDQVGLGNVENINVLDSWSQNDVQYIGTDQIRARDGDGLRLFDDDENGIFVDDGGFAGFGNMTPQTPVDVTVDGNGSGISVGSEASREHTLISAEHSLTGTFAGTEMAYGSYNNLTLDHTTDAPLATFGSHSGVSVTSDDDVTGALVGVYGNVDHNGSGTADRSEGGIFEVRNMCSGEISNATAIRTAIANNGGSIGNAAGLVVTAPVAAPAEIVNNYGIFVEDMSGVGALSDNYALYIEGGQSYFGDYVTFDDDIEITGGIYDGTGLGLPGQILKSDGSTIYWDDPFTRALFDSIFSKDEVWTDTIHTMANLRVYAELIVDSMQAYTDTIYFDDNGRIHGGLYIDDYTYVDDRLRAHDVEMIDRATGLWGEGHSAGSGMGLSAATGVYGWAHWMGEPSPGEYVSGIVGETNPDAGANAFGAMGISMRPNPFNNVGVVGMAANGLNDAGVIGVSNYPDFGTAIDANPGVDAAILGMQAGSDETDFAGYFLGEVAITGQATSELTDPGDPDDILVTKSYIDPLYTRMDAAEEDIDTALARIDFNRARLDSHIIIWDADLDSTNELITAFEIDTIMSELTITEDGVDWPVDLSYLEDNQVDVDVPLTDTTDFMVISGETEVHGALDDLDQASYDNRLDIDTNIVHIAENLALIHQNQEDIDTNIVHIALNAARIDSNGVEIDTNAAHIAVNESEIAMIIDSLDALADGDSLTRPVTWNDLSQIPAGLLDGIDDVDDADNDPVNEIQNLFRYVTDGSNVYEVDSPNDTLLFDVAANGTFEIQPDSGIVRLTVLGDGDDQNDTEVGLTSLTDFNYISTPTLHNGLDELDQQVFDNFFSIAGVTADLAALEFRFEDDSTRLSSHIANDGDLDATNEIQDIFNHITDGVNTYTVASTSDSIRFEGTGNATVSVDPSTGVVTINSITACDLDTIAAARHDTVVVDMDMKIMGELIADSIQAVTDTLIVDDNILVHGGIRGESQFRTIHTTTGTDRATGIWGQGHSDADGGGNSSATGVYGWASWTGGTDPTQHISGVVGEVNPGDGANGIGVLGISMRANTANNVGLAGLADGGNDDIGIVGVSNYPDFATALAANPGVDAAVMGLQADTAEFAGYFDGKVQINGKATSASTEAADPGITLTTKDYVDSLNGAINLFNSVSDGDQTITASSPADNILFQGTGLATVTVDSLTNTVTVDAAGSDDQTDVEVALTDTTDFLVISGETEVHGALDDLDQAVSLNSTQIAANGGLIAGHLVADGDLDNTNEIQNLFNTITDGSNTYTVTSTTDDIEFQSSGLATVSVDAGTGVITIDAAGDGTGTDDQRDSEVELSDTTDFILISGETDVHGALDDLDQETSNNRADIASNAGDIIANAIDISAVEDAVDALDDGDSLTTRITWEDISGIPGGVYSDDQTLNLAGLDLSIEDGNTVTFTGWDNDASDDVNTGDNVSVLVNDANYISTGDNVSLLANDANYISNGDNISLLNNDAGFITSPDDADADATNEIQNLFNTITDGSNTYTVVSTTDDIEFNATGSATVSVDPVTGVITIGASGGAGDLDTINATRHDTVVVSEALKVMGELIADSIQAVGNLLSIDDNTLIDGYLTRPNNTLHGTNSGTHINLGRYSVTGTTGFNYSYATVGGGYYNNAEADYTVVSGGQDNTASSGWATIGGGWSNEVSSNYATIGGGYDNTASGLNSVISGGRENIASGQNSSVIGGISNEATNDYTSVSGGRQNVASGEYAIVIGGEDNLSNGFYTVVTGGQNNTAFGNYATVGGGLENYAEGLYSSIPGGNYLRVGNGSFGFRGRLNNPAAELDVSAESNTFHIANAAFHFNHTNESAADFRIDGSSDNLILADASESTVEINGTLDQGYGTVASTAALTLGNGNVFSITGTDNITSITAKPAGTVVHLIFAGSLTVVDGGNLLLNTSFSATANDVLTIVSDGTNWYEISRSNN